MGKRFTDTAIWEMPWYRKLSPIEKCAFNYIKDRCDAVGVWKPDFELAEYMIGEKIDWDHLRESVNGNLQVLPNGKWFMVDFCQFQYGELNPNCKPHASYLQLLRKHGIAEGYSKGIHTLQEKEKEKDPEKEKEPEEEKDARARGSPRKDAAEVLSTKVDNLISRLQETDKALMVGLDERARIEQLQAVFGDDVFVAVFQFNRHAKKIKPWRFFLKDFSDLHAEWQKTHAPSNNGRQAPTLEELRQERESSTPEQEHTAELQIAEQRRAMKMPLTEVQQAILRQAAHEPLSDRDREVLGLAPPVAAFPEGDAS